MQNALPEPVPYSGEKDLMRTELVENDDGLLVRSEESFAESFAHVAEFIQNNHVPKLREIGELPESEIADIEKRGLGERPAEEGLSVHEGLIYATWGKRALALDLYVPGDPNGGYPVVIIVHGGGWTANSHRTYRNFAMKLANRGYATACVEYRLTGEATYPAAIHDIKAAIRWVRANAKAYSLDADRISLLGASAGGQLSALVALTYDDPRYEGPANNREHSSAVKCMVLLDGFMNGPVSQAWLNENDNPALVDETNPYYRLVHKAITIPSILLVDGFIVKGEPKSYNWIRENRKDVVVERITTSLPHGYELADGEHETVLGWVDGFLKQHL